MQTRLQNLSSLLSQWQTINRCRSRDNLDAFVRNISVSFDDDIFNRWINIGEVEAQCICMKREVVKGDHKVEEQKRTKESM